MVQILTVCRIGEDWGVRDVTGEAYGRSPDIRQALETAEQLAHHDGSRVVLTKEAEAQYRLITDPASCGSTQRNELESRRHFGKFFLRLARRRGGR